MRKYSVGIVGTGVGIRTHLAGCRILKNVRVIGVVGSSPARTAELLNKSGEPEALAIGWNEMLSIQPDLICLTTALDSREKYLQDMRNYPGSLLIEKPISASFEEGQAIIKQLGTTSARSYSDFQLRGGQVFQYIRDIVNNGCLGRVYEITLFERTSTFRKTVLPAWMNSRSLGGGQAYAMGSHLVDLGLFVSAIPYSEVMSQAQISGFADRPRGSWVSSNDPHLSDEFFGCYLHFKGIRMIVTTTSISPGPRTLEFRLEATEGSVEFRYRDGFGSLTICFGDGHKTTYSIGYGGRLCDEDIAMMNPSFFRITYPPYLELVLSSIGNERSPYVASLEDGVLNAAILEKAVELTV
jgi:predicted dehydrogenase